MTNLVRVILATGLSAILCLTLWRGVPPGAAAQARPPFERVAELLTRRCDSCHSRDLQAHRSGFYTGSYEALIDGAFRAGQFRPAILPRNAQASPLMQTLEGGAPSGFNHRGLLPPPEMQAFRDWIDQGAQRAESTYEEHELNLRGVPIDPETHSFWLACASREDKLDVSKRVKVFDEGNSTVAYDWPGADSERFDGHGRWDQWKVTVPATVKGPVRIQLLVAGVGYTRSASAAGRDPADGSVFVLDPKRMAANDLDEIAAAVVGPMPPPHRSVELRFRTRTDADLTLDVFRSKSPAGVFHKEERDLPPGPNSVIWTFGQPRPAAGWYEASLRFRARRPGTTQPDMALVFQVTP
jgi:hypothetical protein